MLAQRFLRPSFTPRALAALSPAQTRSREGRELYEQKLREIFTSRFQLEPLTNRVGELAVPVRAEIERKKEKTRRTNTTAKSTRLCSASRTDGMKWRGS
jgi:hypothetical protein